MEAVTVVIGPSRVVSGKPNGEGLERMSLTDFLFSFSDIILP